MTDYFIAYEHSVKVSTLTLHLDPDQDAIVNVKNI